MTVSSLTWPVELCCPGFLGQCMENLLLDQDFWLSSLDQEYFAIEISIQEETLNLMYKGILMQEGNSPSDSQIKISDFDSVW